MQAVPKTPAAMTALIAKKAQVAASTGVLDLRHVGTDEALAKLKELSAVYVADVRHNK